MSFTTTSALAVTFAWVSAPACWRITISGTPYAVDVGALTAARMCLGKDAGGSPGTNGAIDFIRHVLAAINTAVTASGRTFTLTLGADDRLTLAVDSGTFTLAHLTTAGLLLARTLGFIPTGSGVASVTADDQPWYLATAIAVQAEAPVPSRSGAAERDSAGRVYAFGAGVVSYTRRITLPRIPRNPAACTDEDCHATPLYPADANLHQLADTGTARRWSWLDVIEAGRNTTVALALYTWQEHRGGSTSAQYFEGYLSPEDLQLSPAPSFPDGRWVAWTQHEVTHLLPGIGEAVVATRA
jgi:hypothetical protein